MIVPAVHIISPISQGCGAAPPKPAMVTSWKDRYLAIFDEQIDGLDPAGDFAEKRRQIIEETSVQLEERSRQFWRAR